MQKGNTKPVLLSNEQMAALRRIQEQEREKSALGVAPSLHSIARALMDKALKQSGYEG